ncbi:MAG: response regulator [Acidobacteriota bacterium]|jgi:two-component system NtrC family sensor kinase|nr:response regulator [Acidobacteriota bacterium]
MESAAAGAVGKIAALAGGSQDLKAVLSGALDVFLDLCVCDAGFVRLNAVQEKSRRFLSQGFGKESASLLRNVPETSLRIPECAEEWKPGAITEALRKDGLQSFVLHPVNAEGHAVGYVGLGWRGRASARARAIPAACLDVLGVVIVNAGLRQQSGKLAEDLVALQEVNKITTQGFNLDDLIQRIVAEGKRLAKSNHCHLFLLDESREHLVGAASTQKSVQEISGVRIKLSNAPTVMASFRERRGIAVEDLRQTSCGEGNGCVLDVMKWRAAIIAPLLTQEQATGVLICNDETEGGQFTDDEVMRAEMLAHQAAIVLENARLFQVVSRSQKSWETTFDAMQDCVSVHDTSGKIIRANVALAKRLKTIPQKVVGRYCSEVYGPAGGAERCCRHRQPFEPGAVVMEEVAIPHMDGVFQISISPWYDKNNQIAGSIHVASDISNEKLLQQQLIQSEKLSAIGELISGIAHELNNPLTGVMGYSQLLQLRRDLDDRAKESLAKINDLALRCRKIVQNLLSFARKQKPERTLSDINDILEKTVELRGYDLMVNNIEVTPELDRTIPPTIADAQQLQQVFLNVITNAEQAMLEAHGKGHLTIRTGADAQAKTITVEIIDDGPGISEKQQMRIFDPFFTTKEVGKGTGLGLSLSYGMIKEHGGDIYVKSNPGKGAHFFIEIPIVHAPDEDDGQAPDASPEDHALTGRENGKRILAVDDERYILDFLTEVFRSLSINIDTANNSQAAMEKIQENRYDLVLTDYKMPRMSGRDLFNWVRENRPSLAGKIIFMTGDVVNPETHSFFEDNQIRYLAKPFKIEEVKEMVLQGLELDEG